MRNTFSDWILDNDIDNTLVSEIISQSDRGGFSKINNKAALMQWLGSPKGRIMQEQVNDLWQLWLEHTDLERASS